MDFAELSYWLDATTDYERLCVERGGGESRIVIAVTIAKCVK